MAKIVYITKRVMKECNFYGEVKKINQGRGKSIILGQSRCIIAKKIIIDGYDKVAELLLLCTV